MSADARVECFFDCSSPWTYLGFEGLVALSGELGVAVRWRPILVGGVFNTVNPSVYAARQQPVAPKMRYMQKDLADWARHAGLAITFPPTIFPINSAKAMRGCIAMERRGKLVPFTRAVFESYWGRDEDIRDDTRLAGFAAKLGEDPDGFLHAIGSEEVKGELRANTDELIARGGFGTPTFFLDRTDMYFGNDRLPLLRERIRATAASRAA